MTDGEQTMEYKIEDVGDVTLSRWMAWRIWLTLKVALGIESCDYLFWTQVSGQILNVEGEVDAVKGKRSLSFKPHAIIYVEVDGSR